MPSFSKNGKADYSMYETFLSACLFKLFIFFYQFFSSLQLVLETGLMPISKAGSVVHLSKPVASIKWIRLLRNEVLVVGAYLYWLLLTEPEQAYYHSLVSDNQKLYRAMRLVFAVLFCEWNEKTFAATAVFLDTTAQPKNKPSFLVAKINIYQFPFLSIRFSS